MTIVSNSDIETFQKCPRMFYYSRVRRLAPSKANLPPALKRGSFGHKLMEKGFETILLGGSIQDATQAAALVLEELLNSDDPHASEMMGVYRHVCAFLSFATSEKCIWRPVALEETGMWNITQNRPAEPTDSVSDRIFAYTPDMIVEFTEGLYKGQHAVLDYKFLGQYMKEIALNMSQQIPKYLIYRNKTHTDFKIRRGAFVQLNTRALISDTGHKLFLIKWLDWNKNRLEQIERENERWVEIVARAYENPDADNFLRTVNKDVCNWCFFGQFGLCQAEFDGKPQNVIDKIVDREFVRNTYGYMNGDDNGADD